MPFSGLLKLKDTFLIAILACLSPIPLPVLAVFNNTQQLFFAILCAVALSVQGAIILAILSYSIAILAIVERKKFLVFPPIGIYLSKGL
jgi:hypothetical protein